MFQCYCVADDEPYSAVLDKNVGQDRLREGEEEEEQTRP